MKDNTRIDWGKILLRVELILLFAGWIGLYDGYAQYQTFITFNGNNVSISGGGAVEGANGCVNLTDANRNYYIRGNTTTRSLWLNNPNRINLYLQGANISGNRAPIELAWDNSSMVLNLYIDGAEGKNNSYLTGAEFWPALQVHDGQTVNIYETTNTAATASFTGGRGGAGIGGGGRNGAGSDGMDAGKINIFSGNIVATGKNGAAGIGGGAGLHSGQRGGMADVINISGGNVSAYASEGGAGIGSGHGRDYKSINISGGIIYTSTTVGVGDGAGAGIGGGRWVATSESTTEFITISGGYIWGSNIGYGNGSSVSRDVRFYGGSINTDLNKADPRNAGGEKVYKVQTDALNAKSGTVQCSYTGSSGSFYTTASSSGSFYFWMPTGSTNTVTIGTLNNLTVPTVSTGTNYAPLIFSNGGSQYYNLDALSNTSVSNLKLESTLPLYKNITVSNNKTLDLNGKELTSSGTNKLTINNSTLTLNTANQGKLLAEINMASSGLLKVNKTNNKTVALGNVYANGTPCYLYTLTFPYGNLTNCNLVRNDNSSYFWQYPIDAKSYDIWLLGGENNINLSSADYSYFQDKISPSVHYGSMTMSDRTATFYMDKGPVTVNSDNTISYSVSGSNRTSKEQSAALTIKNTSTTNDLTVNINRAINFQNSSSDMLTINASTLTMSGSATFNKIVFSGASSKLNVENATALSVATGGLSVSDKLIFPARSATPTVTIGGTNVWYASIPSGELGELKDVKQGTVPLSSDYYTNETTAPYYFWLNNTTDDLTFSTVSADGQTTKYYYAATTRTHNTPLIPATFKAHIKKSDTDVTRYKRLADAITVADDGTTVSLIDNATGSNELVRLKSGNPSVTLDLGGNNLDGTFDFDANGGRLTLVSSGNGKIQSATTLSGLVYTEMSGDNMTGTISRNGSAVVRYLVDKPFAAGSIFYSCKGYTSEAMMVGDKACLWLPRDMELGDVSLGYSTNMQVDKCGEIPALGSLSAHSSNLRRVNPYLNIAKSGLEIGGNSSNLEMTYNTIKVAGFDADQLTTVYGTGTNPIKVGGGANVQKLRLRNLSIPLTGSNDYPAIKVEGTGTKLSLFLSGKNNLKGGSKGGGISAGINVSENATVEINNDDSSDEQLKGTGQLTVKGGALISQAAPGIGGNYGEPCGTIIINGGTIKAEGGISTFHGIGNGGGVNSARNAVTINAGSINASREWVDKNTPHAFKNSKGNPVYLMTVNTGLSANKKYQCVYHECSPEPFTVLTDEYGKCYFWIPEQKQADKPTATFIDPATSTPTVVQLVKVDKHDKNVAPIVAELVQPGKETEYHNNLKDAFEAVTTDEATIRLLIDIDNLSTVQTVKTGRRVTLDLDRFNLDTKNSKDGGFTVETGGYLYITGEGESGTGNIKSTFKISGDIYIAGIVPLTDASPMLGDRAVFRTLVKGLPDSPNTIYSYSYGSISNRNFNLHDGIACLWLPDGNSELTFRVTQGSNVTDYTAGTLTTSTQRTDAIASLPVGVIARVVNGAKVQDFNNLSDAFTEAAKTAGNTVRMLANISLTKAATIETTPDTQHNFILDLNGFSLDGASGSVITVGPGRYLTITDTSAGVKGGLNISIILNGNLFVSGNINVKGTVTKAGTTEVLWRTMVDVKSMTPEPTEVVLESVTSNVLGSEACFWLKERSNAKLTFTVGGTNYDINGVNINTNHQDNLVTLGVGDDQAMIRGGKKYKTFALAWEDALLADEAEIVLLKDATINAPLTMNIADKKISIDVARYSLAATNSANLTVEADNTLVINSSNGNGRMLVPLVNKGVLYIGQGIQADRVTESVVDENGAKVWRALVSNLPDGMPDDGTYTFIFGKADGQSEIATGAQTGSFYVKSGIACVWLKEQKAYRLKFDQFKSWTDNVTIEPNHANQVIWGQSNVAQVLNKMYTQLSKAFAENSNQTVTLLKGAVLEITQRISSRMVLALDKYSVSPMGSPASLFDLQSGGSLQVTGNGSLSTDIQIDFSQRVEGSNANLAMEEGVIMTGKVTASTTDYYRATVQMPDDVRGELDYVFGTQTGKVTAVAGKPLTLWLRASAANETNDMKFIQGEKSWLATSVRIVATHVNLISVKPIEDEAKIAGGDYYKTLTLALSKAAGTQTVEITRSLNGLTGKQELNSSVSGTVTLDLKDFTLTSAGAVFDAANAQLVIGNGYLNGELAVAGNIFAHPTLSMENTRVKKGDQVVWRTLVELPSAVSVSYTVSGGAPVDVKNTQTIGGKVYACLWLPAANVVSDYVFTVNGKVYPLSNVLITSNHSNELNVANNNPVVKNMTTGQEFATLNTALAMAQENETLQLQADITLLLSQKVDKTVTLDLNGNTFTSSQTGGFVIGTGCKLTIKSTKGGTRGLMVGTFILNNDQLAIEPTVNIEGQVLLAGAAHYRVMIDVDGTKRCEWLKPVGFEYDKEINVSGEIWEATVPARLAGHEEKLTAYKVVTILAGGSWNGAAHTDHNIIVPAGVSWTIPEGMTGSIHRLTIHDGGQVAAKGQVTATEGIRYVRSFAVASKWESISLPFNSARIMTIDGATGEPTLRVPAIGSGTAGDFWLNTMQANGQQQTVGSTEMSANEAYIMAVPAALTNVSIYFVSGPNQLLRKNAVLAVKPQTGFAAYGNGTLADVQIKEKCYVLAAAADGSLVYKRQDNLPYTLAPFRGYLLADLATTENTSELRMGTPTGMPEVVPGSRSLCFYTGPGFLRVNSPDSRSLPIYTIEGRMVTVMRLTEGDNRITLPTGLYAVYRQILFIP